MYDIHVILKNSPGLLGSLGSVLGKNGVGLEGGGVFTTPEAGLGRRTGLRHYQMAQ